MTPREAAAKAERKAARKAARKADRKPSDGTAAAAAAPAAADDDEDDIIAAPPQAKRAKRDESASRAATTAAVTTAAAVTAYLAAHELIIHDETAPPPCLTLAEAPFPRPLLAMLCRQPFTAPSPVQAATWPIAVAGRDVLAIAKTGSGKTLGFLLPVLTRCAAERKKNKTVTVKAARGSGGGSGPLGIVMAPTRELALQISVEATKFGACVGVASVAVYGGAAKQAQVNALQRGCELIIGTPGRIKDVLDVRGGGAATCVSCSEMTMVVLDEADRMLDMGFERDIRDIVRQCFNDGSAQEEEEEAYRPHQTFLYSATWPLEVQGIAADLLASDAVKVTVGTGGEKLTASKSIVQRVHVVEGTERMETFAQLIAPFGKGGKNERARVIVFANRKDTVKALAKHCAGRGMTCDVLSGDRSQSQRNSTLRKFKEGAVTIVIATDVAARGWVIHRPLARSYFALDLIK